jgi:LPS export ABC transporter protein LptC
LSRNSGCGTKWANRYRRTGGSAISISKPISLLFLSLSLLGACGRQGTPPIAGGADWRGLPDQESWNSKVIFSDSGRTRAILKATHISQYEARRETLLDSGVTVDFFDGDGAHTAVLTSRRGRVNDETRDLEAFENVVFRSDSGTVVKTEYLLWENAQKKIRGDKFVTIDSPKEHLEGYGFEADQNLKNYVIFRVSGQTEFVKEK